jgi:hypothetical protein
VILGLLGAAALLVDRWWHRRKAREHAEALTRQTVAVMVAAAQPVGGVLLGAFRQLTPMMNDAAKSIGRFNEAFRDFPDPEARIKESRRAAAAKAAESDESS